MIRSILLLLVCLWSSFLAGQDKPPFTKIAFGSCSDEDNPDQLWNAVIQENPNLWIWLGDNIYGDTEDMHLLKQKYAKQSAHPDYQKLLSTCPIIGTWDDHDYGVNDGGKDYPRKKESKELLLQFLNVPADASVRKHEGVYSSYTLGEGQHKIKIILLDTRYFRDALIKSKNPNDQYIHSSHGDMLGKAQWKWLKKELKHSDASLHIIGSSIQFIPTEHNYEKWVNLSGARERMLRLLVNINPKNVIFISGDRHIAEISKLPVNGLPYPLYDFTSSGLTHTWKSGSEENKYRVGDMIKEKNFGIIKVDWSGAAQPAVTLEVHGKEGTIYLTEHIQF